MQLKKGQVVRIPVLLLDPAESPVSGVTAPFVYLKKAGGASAQKSIINNTNWFEIDSTNFPGLYDLELSATDVGTAGPLYVSARGGSSSVCQAAHLVLESLPEDARAAADLARKLMGNDYVTDVNASTLTILDDDKVTPLRVFNLKDDQGNPSARRIFERRS